MSLTTRLDKIEAALRGRDGLELAGSGPTHRWTTRSKTCKVSSPPQRRASASVGLLYDVADK